VNKNITKQHALRLQYSDDYDIRDDYEIDCERTAQSLDVLKNLTRAGRVPFTPDSSAISLSTLSTSTALGHPVRHPRA
jgi:hypothetical protein